MANYVRRLVSGYKDRFRDEVHGVDLDLIYLTDQIIIMGYPADGIEGYYRNKREDVKKFLNARHQANYWVFNLCPLTENSYSASLFDGRVSRHPFPDHHAPPLAILALAAREIREWLHGSDDRVAVIHCKAGKGRSGTIACSYLLAQETAPTAPKLQRSYTTKQWARTRAEELLDAVELEEEELEASAGREHQAEDASSHTADNNTGLNPQGVSVMHAGPELEDVLALHTSRRMRRPSSPSDKQKRGVSIPSQRRFLSYWALVLAHAAPSPFWAQPPVAHPKVRLSGMRVRLREPGGAKMTALRIVNSLLETAGVQQGRKKAGRDVQTDELWVSVARYNDDFVDALEKWEQHTRDPSGKMGRRKPNTEHMATGPDGEERLEDFFRDGKWDKGKMVNTFSHLSTTDVQVTQSTPEAKSRDLTYTLNPIPHSQWVNIRRKIKAAGKNGLASEPSQQSFTGSASVTGSPDASRDPSTENLVEGDGLILDACREVRAKLYLGQIFLGWFWFIPIFHMTLGSADTAHFILTRKEIDFSVGAGAWINEVDVALDWVDESPCVGDNESTSTDSSNVMAQAQSAGVTVQDTAAML